MMYLPSFILLILTVAVFSDSVHESKRLYSELCSATARPRTELASLKSVQPTEGWRIIQGSDVERDRYAHVLSALSSKDANYGKNIGNDCFTLRVALESDTRSTGDFFAAENLYGTYKCSAKTDLFGFLTCVMKSSDDERGEVMKWRFSYTDYENNLFVVLSCYPMHEEVGWHTLSSTVLSSVQRKNVDDHVKTLGFSPYSTVSWCTDFNAINKKPSLL